MRLKKLVENAKTVIDSNEGCKVNSQLDDSEVLQTNGGSDEGS